MDTIVTVWRDFPVVGAIWQTQRDTSASSYFSLLFLSSHSSQALSSEWKRPPFFCFIPQTAPSGPHVPDGVKIQSSESPSSEKRLIILSKTQRRGGPGLSAGLIYVGSFGTSMHWCGRDNSSSKSKQQTLKVQRFVLTSYVAISQRKSFITAAKH